jgi:hypothetical protein
MYGRVNRRGRGRGLLQQLQQSLIVSSVSYFVTVVTACDNDKQVDKDRDVEER